MRRQHGPNHKLSRSQRASVFGNTFMFCHKPELRRDSLVLTCLHFSGQHVAVKGLRKKGRCCPSEFVPSYLFLSYTLAVHGFSQKERRSLTRGKPAGDICARICSSACWDGCSGFYLSPPEHSIPTPLTPLSIFFVELLYLLQTSKHQEDNITISYVLTLLIKEAPANR